MIVVDAGPLIAILDRNYPDHTACVGALADLTGPLLTTWPVFTEAMYMLGARVGWSAQEALWKLVGRDELQIVASPAEQVRRARDLMAKYRDRPVDLADATLVALADALGEARVFTLDADFRVYRFRGRQAFTMIP